MWPDFGGASIVNLMSDVVRARSGRADGSGLRDVDVAGWREARTVVLLVLDGVGMAQLDLLPEDAFLRRHCATALTSVFPSTTATAITTFMTAQPPAVHGLTGWHVRCTEPGLDGQVLAILPVTPRGGGRLSCSPDEALARVCRVPSVYQGLSGGARIVSPADIAFSPFNLRHGAGAQCVGYEGLDGLFETLDAALDEPVPPGYVHAYWPDFDHFAHMRGCASDSAREVLRAADSAIAAWVQRTAGRDVLLLVTADHGFIDAPADRLLEIENFPAIAACLEGPLSGERRAVFVHLKPGMASAFERALGDLEHACRPWPSADLLRDGRFGPGEPHPRLRERIGDYTLEMKSDWTLRDTLPNERAFRLVGVHGGTSEAEMMVPLAVVYA
ncbi:alkaline phosphatase family protein [Methyloversatilis sp.]|uniref:alkaline phosphatase family protein n=1 Tax=Methyloversatilis sp. TaxID=2569862 RepID=UPI0035B10531